jgi:hypothetical protein
MLRINVNSISTADATVTVFWQKAVAINTMFRIKGEILARKSDRAAGYTCNFEALFRRASAGSLVLVSSAINNPLEDSSGTPAVTITASSNNARINVQGIAAETWDWKFVNLEYSGI